MPSSYTASARYELQATGENINTWGARLDTALTLVDFNVNGWTTKALTGNYTLTSNNGTSDEARSAMLKFTGTGAYTVTVPAVSKAYMVWNACTGVLTMTNGSTSVTVQSGEVVIVITDGGASFKRVQPTDFASASLTNVASITGLALPTTNTQAASKLYVDNAAFAGMSGTLPGQLGNSGKFITTDGTTASWGYAVTIGAGLASVSNATVTVTAAVAADVQAGTSGAKAATPAALTGSAAPVTLTDAATVAWDVSTGYNATVTLGGNRTIGAPTNLQSGVTYSLELVQDGSGSRIPSWASIWDFGAAGTPTLQTTAAKADKVFAQYNARTSKLDATFRKGA